MSIMTDDYFAGLFDGEGTLRISYNGQQYQLLISLGMTDERPVQAIKDRFGGWVELRTNEGTAWKPVHIWRGSSKTAIAFLDAVEHALVVKKKQAVTARKFQALLDGKAPKVTDEKHQMYLEMREHNRRGNS